MQSRPARRRIWLASLAVVVIAILVFSAVVVNRRDRVKLASGMAIEWLGITKGTNVLVDGNIVEKLLGDRISAGGWNLGSIALNRPRTFRQHGSEIVAWVRVINPSSVFEQADGSELEKVKIHFRNRGGRELEAGRAQLRNSSSNEVLLSIPVRAYPRDEQNVKLRIGVPHETKEGAEWAEFELITPSQVRDVPTWSAQQMPATNFVEGERLILENTSVSKPRLCFTLPSALWQIAECTIHDSEGNWHSWSQMSGVRPENGKTEVHFEYNLETNRIWKARVKIVRTVDYIRPERGEFLEAERRRISISESDPATYITNNIGEVFTCKLRGGPLDITGISSFNRPYWVVLSAKDEAGKDVSLKGGSAWSVAYRQPVSQSFWVSGSPAQLSLELACPPVLVTEFYFVPGTGK